MEIRTIEVNWFRPTEDGGAEVSTVETRTIMRVASQSDRWVTRLGVDELGNFCATELRIEYVDHVIDSSGGLGRFAPQELVAWQGEYVPAVLGSTDALWATEEAWEDRAEAQANAHADWEAYGLESPEFRAQWSYSEYALGFHIDADDEE